MAFRKKCHHLLEYAPDLVVIQECENQERLKFGDLTPTPKDFIWIGNKESKGVGIFSYSDWNLKLAEFYDPNFEYIIPIHVLGKSNFLLFAIWAMPFPNSPSKSYVNQIWRAMNHYDKFVSESSILIGDFNSNAIWDSKYKNGNHTDLVNFLSQRTLKSIYHELNSEIHGKENKDTLYLLKNENKPYHMDYCFASKNRIVENTTVEIGQFNKWIKQSDHMPVIIKGLA